MKSRKTTTRHWHLRRTRLSGKVPVRQHPMNYWGVTAIARGGRKRELVSGSFTSPKKANSFKKALSPHWKNPRVVRLKDSDKDGVPDVSDCAPNDITRQGIIHDLSKAKESFKKTSSAEKQKIKEKLREINKVVRDRKSRHKLSTKEKKKILKIANTFKKEHPHITASVKGLVAGGFIISVLGATAGLIPILVAPGVILTVGKIMAGAVVVGAATAPGAALARRREEAEKKKK